MSTITIRPYQTSDFQAIIQLFKEAVAAINIRHYSPEQIAVWTNIDPARWQTKLENMIVFVAEMDSIIVGFADMTREGYLDHLYVHKDYQARWVSLHLFKAIEKAARELGLTKIATDCSITAKVPAERKGFKVVKEQIVEKNGVQFTNYHMEKKLSELA
jgi:putative acetyltransferase